MDFSNFLKEEKKQWLQSLFDVVFWIVAGVLFFMWSKYVMIKGNELPIAYDGLDALNELAVYGARDLLVEYIALVIVSYVIFFLLALIVYVITHYVKWCIVLKKKPSWEGLKRFSLLSLIYSIPLYAIFTTLFIFHQAEGIIVFAFLYIPLFYVITQVKVGTIAFESIIAGFKSVKVNKKLMGIAFGIIGTLIFINFVFVNFSPQQLTLLIVILFLVCVPVIRYYFAKETLRGRKRHG